MINCMRVMTYEHAMMGKAQKKALFPLQKQTQITHLIHIILAFHAY